MKKRGWLCISVLILVTAATGCSLEAPFEGDRCGSDDNPLAYTIFQGERCDADNCTSSDNCCGIEDADARALMADAFKHHTCPVNSSYDKCVHDNGVNFCSGACGKNEVMCRGICLKTANYHVNSCDENGIICKDGYADCNDDVLDGCEVNLRTLHLKSCKNGVIECADGFASCDNDLETGCETSVLGNQYNCGKCDNICKDENPYCLSGECSNKCEYDICNNVCMQLAVNHIQSCNPGNNILNCTDGYGNCNKLLEDGCEVDLNNTPDHCGECGHACEDGEVCSSGECIENKCPEETPDNCMVGGVRTCMDVHADDFNNCGSCGYRCQEHPMLGGQATSATCENGLCIYDCTPGLIRMSDEATADLIQCINPNNNNTYCGAKSSTERGTKCEDNEVCTQGKCEINTCEDPTTLCKINGESECINVRADNVEHCGGCNVNCQGQSALYATSNTCVEGKCKFDCSPGYVNISTGTARDTIQCVDGLNDRNHCGAESPQKPGVKCNERESCVNGECIINDCDAQSSTPDLCITGSIRECKNIHADDAGNCGSCGYNCSEHPISNAASEVCKSGECQYKCTGNFVNISNGSTSGTINCINPLNDHDHCGTNASNIRPCSENQSCSNGNCINTSCTDGKRLCEGECIYVSDDPKNCGDCNNRCPEQQATHAHSEECKSGICQFECEGGFVNVSKSVTQADIRCIDPMTNDDFCGAKSSEDKGKTCTGNTHCRDGVCVECVQNSNCPSSKPVCNNGSCVVCAGSQGCSGSTPVCLDQTRCVACTSDSHCSGSTPACNNNQCIACTSDSHCRAPFSHCQNSACVECTSDSHCTVSGTQCNTSTNKCECKANYIQTSSSNGVVTGCRALEDLECYTNSDCTNRYRNSTCNNNSCVCIDGYVQSTSIELESPLGCVKKCTSSSDCAGDATCNLSKGICICKYFANIDPETGEILSCKKNATTGCTNNNQCIGDSCTCNTNTGECVSHTPGGRCNFINPLE